MAQGQSEFKMNDISFLQYGDFTKTWKLVTVRYRQDTHEMRFTYANDVAWEHLNKGSSDYPKGSVFAKVGFKSGIDPAFNSSIVPNGARRFQYMVRDKDKYADTDGWGYAVFKSDGTLFDGDVKANSTACNACHRLVPERGLVFSEPLEFSPFTKEISKTYPLQKNKSHIFFVKLPAKEFKGDLKVQNKKMNLHNLHFIDGEIRRFFFGGTLDEVTPLLINQVLNTGEPAGFLSQDFNTFKIIVKNSRAKCSERSTGFRSFESRAEWTKGDKKLISNEFCFSGSNL